MNLGLLAVLPDSIPNLKKISPTKFPTKMRQNGSENGTPLEKHRCQVAAAALRVTSVISRPSQVTWWEMEGGETCSTTARGRRAAFESTNHPILVTSIFFCGLFFEGRV